LPVGVWQKNWIYWLQFRLQLAPEDFRQPP